MSMNQEGSMNDAAEVPMLERLARAMWEASNPGLPEYRWGELGAARQHWSMLARTVVERLNKPTESMLNAARDWSAAKYGKPVGNDGALGCWQAMLSAIAKAEA